METYDNAQVTCKNLQLKCNVRAYTFKYTSAGAPSTAERYQAINSQGDVAASFNSEDDALEFVDKMKNLGLCNETNSILIE